MKKRSKILLSAILTIALCLSLIAGSTFALFTSESKVNIAVTSGKVKVTATLVETSLKLYSATTDSKDAEEHPYEEAGTVTGTNYDATYYYEPVSPDFTNGGTAAISGDTLTLTNVTPGDKVELNINVENESNVNIKYRTRIDVTGETDTKLFEALEISIDGDTQNKKTTISEWKTWKTTDEPREKVVPVTIALPINAGNEYQEKSIKLTFAVEAVQGNAAWALLDQINTKLANEAVANTNMSDALADIDEIADESVIKANNFVWNSETDRFTTESAATTNQVKYFKIYDAMPETQTYSIYASSSWTADTVNVTVGFDAGTKTNITAITYDRQTATVAQTVIIKSNTGTITVNAPLDTVYHYGTAATVNIIAAANSSYHENGTVTFLEVAKGRVALESASAVSQVHIAKVENTDTFDEIILAVAPNITISTASTVSESTAGETVITRDDVTIADSGTLVVALQSGTEEVTEETTLDYVWLTKQGIFEQIKISDSVESSTSNAVWADESTVETKTQDTAKAIANNIARDSQNNINVSVAVESKEYKVALNEDRDLIVVDSADTTETAVATISQSGDVVVNENTYNIGLATNTENKTTELKVTNTATEEVVVTAPAVVDNGLTEEAKETAKEEAIHNEEVKYCQHNYVAVNNYWNYDSATEKYRFFEQRVCTKCNDVFVHEHKLVGMYCEDETCEHMIPFVVTTLDLAEEGKVTDTRILSLAQDLSNLSFNVVPLIDGTFNLGSGDTLPISALNYLACFSSGNFVGLLDTANDYEITIGEEVCHNGQEIANQFSNYIVDFSLEFNVDMDLRALALAGAYGGAGSFAIAPSFTEESRNIITAGTEVPVMGSIGWPITYSYLSDVQFLCGLYIDRDVMVTKMPSILQNYENATVTLRLMMYENEEDFRSGDKDNRIVVNTMTIPLSTIVNFNVISCDVYDNGWNTIYFTSLEDALAASKASEDADGWYLDLHLLCDLKVDTTFDLSEVGETYASEINLDGHTLSGNLVLNGTTLTLCDGTVAADIIVNDITAEDNVTQNAALNLGYYGEEAADCHPVTVTGNITLNGAASSLVINQGSSAPNIVNNGGNVSGN